MAFYSYRGDAPQLYELKYRGPQDPDNPEPVNRTEGIIPEPVNKTEGIIPEPVNKTEGNIPEPVKRNKLNLGEEPFVAVRPQKLDYRKIDIDHLTLGEGWKDLVGVTKPEDLPEELQDPDFIDFLRANAILSEQRSLHFADFNTDLTKPGQQARVDRAHNDSLWANAVVEEYNKTHGKLTGFAAGLVGGLWGRVVGNPVQAGIDVATMAIGSMIGTPVAGFVGSKVVGKFGSRLVDKVLSKLVGFATTATVDTALFAVQNKFEWELTKDRIALELGVGVEELEAPGFKEALYGALIGAGIGLFRNKEAGTIVGSYSFSKIFGETIAKNFTNLIDRKFLDLLKKDLAKNIDNKVFTPQEWTEFVADKYVKALTSPSPVLNTSGTGTFVSPLENTGSIFDYRKEYDIQVQGREAKYNPDGSITSEAALATRYKTEFIQTLASFNDPNDAVKFLGRHALNIVNVADALEKINKNILYDGISEADSKILYEKSIDPEFNKSFFEAVRKKDPTLFKGLSSEAADRKLIDNVLKMNDSILKGLRERGVAVFELEEGYIRQTHDVFKIMNVKKDDWVNYIFGKVDLKKTFPELFDAGFRKQRLADLSVEMDKLEQSLLMHEFRSYDLRRVIKESKKTIEGLTKQTEEAAKDKNLTKGKQLMARAQRFLLSGETKAEKKTVAEKMARRKEINNDLKGLINIARDVSKTKAVPSPVLKVLEKEISEALKVAKSKATDAMQSRAKTKGKIESIRKIKKILKENNLYQEKKGEYVVERTQIKNNLNMARKSLVSARQRIKQVLKDSKKSGTEQYLALKDYLDAEYREFKDYNQFMENKLASSDIKAEELKGWMKATKAYAQEVDELIALRDEAKLQGIVEKDYNARVAELERNLEAVKREAERSKGKNQKEINREVRELEKEIEQTKKEKDKIEKEIDNVQGRLSKIRELKKQLKEEEKKLGGRDLGPQGEALFKRRKELRDELKKTKAMDTSGPDSKNLEAIRDAEIAKIKDDIKNVNTQLDSLKDAKGGVVGQAAKERRTRAELRQEQRYLAKAQTELNNAIRKSSSSRAKRKTRLELNALKREKQQLEDYGALSSDKLEELARESLRKSYTNITEGGESSGTIKVGGTGKYHKQREFHFKDFESWNKYQQDFGHRMSPLQSTVSHMQTSSRRMAALEFLGTDPHDLKKAMDPLIDSLRGQKLGTTAKKQLETANAIMDSLLHSGILDPLLGRDFISRGLDNLNALAGTEMLVNVARYGLIMEPMQAAIWAQRYGLIPKGVLVGQAKGLQLALRNLGAISRRAGNKLSRGKIPKYDKDDMALAGLLYHTNSSYIQAMERNPNLNGKVVKFSKAVNSVVGTDLMQELGHINAATLWNYRIGSFLRDGIKFEALDPDLQRVLKRYGIGEADWAMLAQNNKGMVHVDINTSGKKNVNVITFNAERMLKQAATIEEETLARKLFYAQNDFARVAALQSDPLINNAKKYLIKPSNSKSQLGMITNRILESWFTFGGYVEHLGIQNRQFGLEKYGTKGAIPPGLRALAGFTGMMLGSAWLTNSFMDILSGRKPKLNEKTVLRAVATAAGFGPWANVIFEQFEGQIDDIGTDGPGQSLLGKKSSQLYANIGIGVAKKAAPIGLVWSYNKASNAYKALSNFMEGDNARAMYHAEKAVPFLNWKPWELIQRRLILDNMFQVMDPNAAYRDWLMQSQAAQRAGRPYMDWSRPGSLVSNEAPKIRDPR